MKFEELLKENEMINEWTIKDLLPSEWLPGTMGTGLVAAMNAISGWTTYAIANALDKDGMALFGLALFFLGGFLSWKTLQDDSLADMAETLEEFIKGKASKDKLKAKLDKLLNKLPGEKKQKVLKKSKAIAASLEKNNWKKVKSDLSKAKEELK